MQLELLKDYALQLVGLPYRWAGNDTIEGFDCSGLAIELLQSVGVLPRNYDNTAQGIYDDFVWATTSRKGLGALAFYGKALDKISHVGMMLDTFQIIEAGGGNSKTTSTEAAAAQNAYVRMRPFNYRRDIVAIIMPNYDRM